MTQGSLPKNTLTSCCRWIFYMGSEVLQVAARQFFVWRFFIIRRSSIDEALAHARDQERVALAKPKKKGLFGWWILFPSIGINCLKMMWGGFHGRQNPKSKIKNPKLKILTPLTPFPFSVFRFPNFELWSFPPSLTPKWLNPLPSSASPNPQSPIPNPKCLIP